MRSIWKGSISFGLVNIPVSLYAATRSEELTFRLLRASDMSPINYKRVAEADGKEVPWDHIVKGYEYEKGKFVVLKDEDFRRVDVEAAQTVHIVDFVELGKVNPMFFYKPYYLEPQKGGGRAYSLLRDVLRDTGKVGISKVVIRTRQHLAAVKPSGDVLVLELMHFANELIEATDIKVPSSKEQVGKRELDMAKALVDQMTEEWDASRYTDDYRSALMKLIEEKAQAGGKDLPAPPKRKRASNVIDLVSVLERSLEQSGKAGAESTRKTAKSGAASASPKRKVARKKAA